MVCEVVVSLSSVCESCLWKVSLGIDEAILNFQTQKYLQLVAHGTFSSKEF